MKKQITLVYSTRPNLEPLRFCLEPDDVPMIINQKLEQALMRQTAKRELVDKVGGDVPELAVERWRSAKWGYFEVEVDGPLTQGETKQSPTHKMDHAIRVADGK